ncbi:hypothetical protein CAQUA_10495 [Corynebacterium aquatimens]|nr:hypothetical protein CAQUA_10495 [Corynebacterium aquatimens]
MPQQGMPQQSESGRKIDFPGGPLPIVDAIPFAFKRLFTSQWHVYVGLMALIFIPLLIWTAMLVVPILFYDGLGAGRELPDNPIDLYGVPYMLVIVVFYLLIIACSFLCNVALCTTALRDVDGEKPSWDRVFKDVPWGKGLGAYAAVFGAMMVVVMVFGLLIGLAAAIHPALLFLVVPIVLVVSFVLPPFVSLLPLYPIDGKTTVTGAFKRVWADVKPQFFRVWAALFVLQVVITALAYLTLGIGLIFVGPLSVLGVTFIYRWVATNNGGAPVAFQAGYPQAGYPQPPQYGGPSGYPQPPQ